MPPTNPRIIVADASLNLHQAVRAAMELMSRRPRMIETSTGEDALEELRISSPDLLVSAQTLIGDLDGLDLALAAKREVAALPVIVVANESDPELEEELPPEGMFQYLRRPFAPEAFLRAIRVAIDGPEAAPKADAPEAIIPVPPLDRDKVSEMMYRLMRDVGAMAVVLSDRNGKVISYAGAAGYIDRDALAAALAPGFSDTVKLLPLVGDQPRVLKYYDGERGNLFGLALGLHHYVMLIYDGNAPPSALGNVKRFGFAAINEMLKIVGSSAFDVKPSAQQPPRSSDASHAAAHTTGKRRTRTRTQEMRAVQPEPPPPSRNDSASSTGFDVSLLDQIDVIDLTEADALFDPDRLSAVPSVSGDRISYDDALTQGIIGEIEE
jgi:CheY-like chemotaxis protein